MLKIDHAYECGAALEASGRKDAHANARILRLAKHGLEAGAGVGRLVRTRHLLKPIGCVPLVEHEAAYYQRHAELAVVT
jgi:hypothetical protein